MLVKLIKCGLKILKTCFLNELLTMNDMIIHVGGTWVWTDDDTHLHQSLLAIFDSESDDSCVSYACVTSQLVKISTLTLLFLRGH